MKAISLSILKTWIFLAHSTDPKLAQAKFVANKNINQHFGSIELAQIHLEQAKDKEIEVVVI